METLVVLGVLVFLLAAAAPGLYALRRRMTAEEGRLQFWRMLQRRGLDATDTAADSRALAVAVRRCMLCPRVDDCEAWLASQRREGLEAFCPNAAYVQRLERR